MSQVAGFEENVVGGSSVAAWDAWVARSSPLSSALPECDRVISSAAHSALRHGSDDRAGGGTTSASELPNVAAWSGRGEELVGRRVIVSHLGERPELLGAAATIVQRTERGGYLIRLDGIFRGHEEIAVRPESLVLANVPVPHHAYALAPTMLVRRAWRSFGGDYDGDTDDSADEHADDQRARERSRDPHARAMSVTLKPRPGPTLTVVGTADLHHHHDDAYIEAPGDNVLNLAEWFESNLCPPHVDLVLFAGDLGLEVNEELRDDDRGVDRATTGLHQTPREKDEATLTNFNALLRRICKARPEARVVLCSGNHDGLLCADDGCLACHRMPPWGLGRCTGGRDRWRVSPSAAAAWARERLLEGVEERARVLTDEHWDFTTASGLPVRVVGSPWTSFDTHGKELLAPAHHWRPARGHVFGGRNLTQHMCEGAAIEPSLDCGAWWRAHWGRIGGLLSGAPEGAVGVLLTHTPPLGALDLIKGEAGVSKEARLFDSHAPDYHTYHHQRTCN